MSYLEWTEEGQHMPKYFIERYTLYGALEVCRDYRLDPVCGLSLFENKNDCSDFTESWVNKWSENGLVNMQIFN